MSKPIDTGDALFWTGSSVSQMTWLDYAAIQAAVGLLSGRLGPIGNYSTTNLAESAYEVAQAMLARKRELEAVGE